tara:strand:+ start:549 stop:836 length:288 start_codon:yes stop_codon:yes gene_type:complete
MGAGDAIIGMIPALVATAAIIIVYKTFMDPKTGKKTKYELHAEFDKKTEAKEESADLRKSGKLSRYTKHGKKYRVWVSDKKSGVTTQSIMKWPYD